MCKSRRTCFMFYCTFYFTCDRSLNDVETDRHRDERRWLSLAPTVCHGRTADIVHSRLPRCCDGNRTSDWPPPDLRPSSDLATTNPLRPPVRHRPVQTVRHGPNDERLVWRRTETRDRYTCSGHRRRSPTARRTESLCDNINIGVGRAQSTLGKTFLSENYA